ncbi:hypothetical protein B484DRAFT_399860 [Ochromonadaceae sp. CCMP2298]|nr:hypothetical protein B484DRAFT_399860 [Ochromonadaceae sp. CCMP2298]
MGGGKRHGLYLASERDRDTQSAVLKARIALDFLLFLKLSVAKGAIPALDWDFSKLLRAAARLLPAFFNKAQDAIAKYGSENIFAVSSGGRSLRYTGEQVYGTNILNPEYSKDPDYCRIQAEIRAALPLSEHHTMPGRSGSGEMMFAENSDDEVVLGMLMGADWSEGSEASEQVDNLFAEVGGAAIWRQLVGAIRL